MSKENYVWAWKDDDGVYVNTAKSLEAIVEEIIEFYKEDEIEELTVELNDQIIDISRYLNTEAVLTKELIDRATAAYFVDL